MSTASVREIAEAAKRASRSLASLDEAKRNRVLEAMAAALERSASELFTANQQDMRCATERNADDALPASTLSRLKLTDDKLREMVEQVRSVAALPDPLNRKLDAIELDEGLNLDKVSVPLAFLLSSSKLGLTLLRRLHRSRSSRVTQSSSSPAARSSILRRRSCGCCVPHSRARVFPRTQSRSC